MQAGVLVRSDDRCHLSGMTIVALSSGHGRAGVAVIRLSGEKAGDAVERMAGHLPPGRVATRATLRHPVSGDVLDQGLVLWFPGPASYTGEDVAELQVHGGVAVVSGILEALCRIGGVRIAEPGEFTRRAFLNGKLDLIQAEGIADLVDAETEGQRRQALTQVGGGVSEIYAAWRSRLRDALAHLEAAIDFPDEVLPAGLVSAVRESVESLLDDLRGRLEDERRGERMRNGLYVVIVGAPNVGKSSLLNTLAQRDVAIVSERAGTTRDVVEVHLDLGGLPVIVADTAGLRESDDEIEGEGVRRALARAGEADLRIVMVEAGDDETRDARVKDLIDEDSLVVINKIDRHRTEAAVRLGGQMAWQLSVRTGEGLDSFLRALEERVREGMDGADLAVVTRARHRSAILECVESLERFLSGTKSVDYTNARVEFVAEDLRLAMRSLGRITGHVDVEEMLDVVFRDFCIGK